MCLMPTINASLIVFMCRFLLYLSEWDQNKHFIFLYEIKIYIYIYVVFTNLIYNFYASLFLLIKVGYFVCIVLLSLDEVILALIDNLNTKLGKSISIQ